VSQLNYGELKAAVNKAMRACLRSLDEGNRPQARAAAVSAVDLCSHSLNGGGSLLSGKEKSKTLVRGILAAACRDIADCDELMTRPQLEAREIESLWDRLVGCMERLEFVRLRLEGADVEQLLHRTRAIKDQFDGRFGGGLYANAEIVIRRQRCSVCNDDFRKCDHQAGKVYDGVMCRRMADDATVRTVSFVKQPVDLRCRLWPGKWDEKTRQYALLAMLDSFSVDDLSDPARRQAEFNRPPGARLDGLQS
jgi:hypothetical protein